MAHIDYDEVIIKYKSAKKEASEREISGISSRINARGNKYITAYCHLRRTAKSFSIDSISELRVNGKIEDVKEFWYNNIVDKDKIIKDLQALFYGLDAQEEISDFEIDFDNDIIEIEYIDAEGNETQRRIKPINCYYDKREDDYYLNCFCYLSNEGRIFRASRIKKLTKNGQKEEIKYLLLAILDFNLNLEAIFKVLYNLRDTEEIATKKKLLFPPKKKTNKLQKFKKFALNLFKKNI